MNFSIWNRRDPLVKHLRPFVDPRLHENSPSLEQIWRERVKANEAQREAKKRFEALAAEYETTPGILRLQAD
jgi:hypothetical protein